MIRFAYNTIGATNHRLSDAIDLIADAGYQGVTVTIDCNHLDPFSEASAAQIDVLAGALEAADLAVVLDTNARFVLDPRQRHEPTLLTPSPDGRKQRIELIRRAIDIAKRCRGEAVTFTAGKITRSVSEANAGSWLLEGLKEVAEMAAAEGVVVALEPEPGHLVGSLDDFRLVRDALKQMTDAPLMLALDVGHVALSGERSAHQAIKEFSSLLASVAIGDMKTGVHAHLPPGEGDIDLSATLLALRDVGFEGLVSVKLPRDSHRAHEVIPASLEFLLEHLPSD
ncbi:MAG: sugar phosphate isomerase/epimerase family protein [Pseudomonadota bacterium]